MSAAKHTPGPLAYSGNTVRTTALQANGLGQVVCRMDAANERADADGHLFAAAPELLEALVALLGAPKHDHDAHDSARARKGCERCAINEAARAAIALVPR